MKVAEMLRRLELLDTRVQLDLSLNELRIILNCFRAVEYQMKVDAEPYLDADGFALKSRIEKRYESALNSFGETVHPFQQLTLEFMQI